MLTDKPYNRSHFEALLPTEEREGVRIDDSGVWPATDYEIARRLGLLPEYKALSWKPVFAYSGDGPAPDTKNIPGLPFPFDARDLAAFMLAGVGSFVAEFYGEWRDGPDEDALAEIDPGDSYARQAVREAFDFYRQAEARVGEANAQADLPHGVPSMSLGTDSGRTLEEAQAEAEDAHKTWLKDMVIELLMADSERKELEAKSGWEAVKPGAIDFKMLATPDQLIRAFGNFTGMSEAWFDKWADYPVLKNAIKRKGDSGRGRTTRPLFCPFLVMQGLMKKPRKGSKRQAFLTDEKPWELLRSHFPNLYDTHRGLSPLDE